MKKDKNWVVGISETFIRGLIFNAPSSNLAKVELFNASLNASLKWPKSGHLSFLEKQRVDRLVKVLWMKDKPKSSVFAKIELWRFKEYLS